MVSSDVQQKRKYNMKSKEMNFSCVQLLKNSARYR